MCSACREHGTLIDDGTIALMKARSSWLVPTLYVGKYVVDFGEQMGFSPAAIAKGKDLLVKRDQHIRRAFAAGVKVAFGSDTIRLVSALEAMTCRVPINAVQSARHDVLLCRIDRPSEGFHPIGHLSESCGPKVDDQARGKRSQDAA